jgi:peptide-methionine (S)-S-oxide reductase
MMRKIYRQALVLFLASCCFTFTRRKDAHSLNTDGGAKASKLDTATFAMGCFWCTQAQFQLLKGVKKVIAGYTGGQAVNPSYKQVCTGATGHAEACNII